MISNEQVSSFIKAQPIGVGCGILAVLLAGVIYFRSDSVPEAEALLEEKSTAGERIDANIKNGVQLPEQLNAIIAARNQIEARLVHPDEIATNLQHFYKLQADTPGINMIDLRQNQLVTPKPGVKGPKQNYISVAYAVAVRGTYPHLLEFLRRLETGQRYCRVMSASIVLAGTTDKERANDLTLNLSVELLGQP